MFCLIKNITEYWVNVKMRNKIISCLLFSIVHSENSESLRVAKAAQPKSVCT